jgi:hypothetical protein
MKKGAKLCENLCEKNFPKSAKIGKNQIKHGKSYVTISVAYNNLRRLENSEALTTNPEAAGSNPAGRTRKTKNQLKLWYRINCL